MSESCKLVPVNTKRTSPLQSVAPVLVAIIAAVLASSFVTSAAADNAQYAVIAQVDAKGAALSASDIVVKLENTSIPATSIHVSPDIPRSIAIVIDAGPDQANVLSKEKDLAIALINALSNASSSFTIVSVANSSKTLPTTPDPSVASGYVREIAGDSGEKTSVPIYDAIGSAIRQASLSPGLRVCIFIGEGNDRGSALGYAELRSMAEANQIAFLAAVVADHSLRGAKSLLRYGWNLRELADESVGRFLENSTPQKCARRFADSVQALRLVTFTTPSQHAALHPGKYKVAVFTRHGSRLRTRKTVVIP